MTNDSQEHPRERGIAVVSGAASGIGAATVSALASIGYQLVGLDLAPRPSAFEDVAGLQWVQGDVTVSDTWSQVAELCKASEAGAASAFVPCAADVVVQPVLETPVEQWRRLYEINVIGVVLGLQALVPPMVERGRGAVVVVCSVNSLFAEEHVGAYSATKAALLSVTRTAALESARHGVRINAVCPGTIDTPLLRRHIASLEDPVAAEAAMRRRQPTGAINSPEEVAALIRFLATEDAHGMSGSAVTIDGGLTSTYDFAV